MFGAFIQIDCMYGSDMYLDLNRPPPTKRTYQRAFGNKVTPYRSYKRPRIDIRKSYYRSRNRRVGGFLGIEHKFYDTSLVSSALTAPTDATGGEHNPSGTICLNSVAIGTGESNRDGRQIKMKSLYIEGIIEVPQQANQTVTDTAGVVMIAIVQDKQCNGANLNSEDVFTNPSGSAKLAATPFRNLEYSKRFKVLKKKKIKLAQPITAYDGTNMEQHGYQIPFKMYIKLPNTTVNFTPTAGSSIANITDVSLNVVAYATSLGLTPTISYISRLRFVG